LFFKNVGILLSNSEKTRCLTYTLPHYWRFIMAIKFDASKVAPRFQNHSDKECVKKYVVVALVDNEIRTIMELGIYSGRSASASTIYADFHAYGLGDFENGIYSKGNGKASGGGYNKHNVAAQEAVQNAGFSAFESISGGRIESSLLSIAHDYGYDIVKVIGG
jgi:hypothetical protein